MYTKNPRISSKCRGSGHFHVYLPQARLEFDMPKPQPPLTTKWVSLYKSEWHPICLGAGVRKLSRNDIYQAPTLKDLY